MDETDKKIIELLQQDGRLEDVEIARKIAEKLASKKEFFFVALSLGPTHSIVASCFARDQIILNKLVEELRTWNEIEKIETNIIYEVLKSGYHDIPVVTL